MTKIRRFSPSALPAAFGLFACCVVPSAPALVDLSSGQITLQTTATETYDSYMIGTLDRGSDEITTLTPLLNYKHVIGPTGLTAYAGMAFNRYAKNSRFNSDDVQTGMSSNLPLDEGSRLDGHFDASYIESTQIDQIINDRIPTKTLSGSFAADYKLGLKTTISDTVNYNQSHRKFYGNQTIWSNNVHYTYADFLEDTNLNIGETYTRTKSDAGNYNQWAYNSALIGSTPNSSLDQTANTFSIGASHPIYGQIIGGASYGYMVLDRQSSETTAGNGRQRSSTISLDLTGPLLPPSRFPKIESNATIAYSQSQSPGINDTGEKTITGSLRLAWDARERTRVDFGASRSTSLGSNNFTVENTEVHFGVTEKIGLASTASFNTSYDWRTVRGITRHDTQFRAELGANHPFNRFLSVGASYSFEDNRTDAKTADFVAARYQLENYTRHVVSAFVTFVY